MTKLKSIIAELESLFPISKAEKWDKPGLQYGDLKQSVNKVMVALDLTTDIFEKAIDMQADLIITHHPFLWEETKDEDYKKAPYKRFINTRLENTGIALYSLHTNYDKSKNGTDLKVVEKLDYKKHYRAKTTKFGRNIEEDVSVNKLKERLKSHFGITTSISNSDDKNKVYKKFAILPGSGSIEDIISLHEKEGINLIVTSDIKWSDWITINELGVTIIEITHGVETVFAEDITKIIKNRFDDIEVNFDHSFEIGKL